MWDGQACAHWLCPGCQRGRGTWLHCHLWRAGRLLPPAQALSRPGAPPACPPQQYVLLADGEGGYRTFNELPEAAFPRSRALPEPEEGLAFWLAELAAPPGMAGEALRPWIWALVLRATDGPVDELPQGQTLLDISAGARLEAGQGAVAATSGRGKWQVQFVWGGGLLCSTRIRRCADRQRSKMQASPPRTTTLHCRPPPVTRACQASAGRARRTTSSQKLTTLPSTAPSWPAGLGVRRLCARAGRRSMRHARMPCALSCLRCAARSWAFCASMPIHRQCQHLARERTGMSWPCCEILKFFIFFIYYL